MGSNVESLEESLPSTTDIEKAVDIHQKLEEFARWFTKYFEEKLREYGVESEVKGQAKTGKTGKVLAEPVGAAVGGTAGVVATLASGVPGLSKAGSAAGSKFTRLVWNYSSGTKHRTKAKRITEIFSRLEKFELRQMLVGAALIIFQNYEWQFVHSTDLQGSWRRAMQKLAMDARNRVIQYFFEFGDDILQAEIDSIVLVKGVVFGKSKEGIAATFLPQVVKSIASPKDGLTLKNTFNSETWKTTGVYEGVGIAVLNEHCVPDKFLVKKADVSQYLVYGCRLPFAWESLSTMDEWNEVDSVLQGNYEYTLVEISHDEQAEQILKVINGEDPDYMLGSIETKIEKGNTLLQDIQTSQTDNLTGVQNNHDLLLKVEKDQAEIKETVLQLQESTIELKEVLDKQKNKGSKRKIFNVQHPVKSFTGRTRHLEILQDLLMDDQHPVIVAITGLGGVGKSELAKKCVHTFYQKNDVNVVWIAADTEFDLKRSVFKIASQLEVPLVQKRYDDDNIQEERDLTVITRDMYLKLSDSKSIFVFDSVENLNSIYNLLPLSLPPDILKPNILITSRSQDWDIGDEGDIETICLGTFSPDESMDYIKKILDIESDYSNDDLVWELSERLQYFPLALQQATAYIKEKNSQMRARAKEPYFIDDYLKDFDHQNAIVNLIKFRSKYRQDRYSETLYTTWKVTFDQIEGQEHGSNALKIVELLAYLGSNDVAVEWAFSRFFESQDMLWNAVDLLAQYSIVNLDKGTISIHSLIQTVLRLWMKESDREKEVLVKAINRFHFEFDAPQIHFTTLWSFASHYDDVVESHLFDSLRYFDKVYIFGSLVKAGYAEAVKNILNLVEVESSSSRYIIEWDLFGDVEFTKNVLKCTTKLDLLQKRKEILTFQAVVHGALARGNIQEIESYVEHMKPEEINAWLEGTSLLYNVSSKGRLDILQSLLTHTVDVNCRNRNNETCLHAAASSIYHEIVKLLIEHGADCNVKGRMNQTPLHDAVGNGHFENVRLLLKHGSNVESINVFNCTATHLAGMGGYVEIIRYLAKVGANLEARDMTHSTPLLHAARNGNVEIVELLIQNNVDINVQDMNGSTPLHVAVHCSRFEIAKVLLHYNCDMDLVDTMGQTALHLAVESGHLQTIELLVKKGFDVNSRSLSEVTPLHIAAGYGKLATVQFLRSTGRPESHPVMAMFANLYYNVVEFLANKNAKLNVANNTGVTPLHAAIESGHFKMAKLLEGRGANIRAFDNYGRSVLHIAAENGRLEIFQYFIEKKIQYRNYDEMYNTPLHYASRNGHLKIVQYIMLKKRILDERNSLGCTAVFESVRHGHLEILRCLVQNGANVNLSSIFGSTPLNIAADNGFFEILKCLVENRGDFKKPGAFGRTCLHDAAENGHFEIVRYLVEKGAPPNICDDHEQTLLHASAKGGYIQTFKYILKNFGDTHRRDIFGRNCLHYATGNGHLEIVEYIVENNLVGLDVADNDGNTILHIAALHGQYPILEYFLSAALKDSSFINGANNHGATPLTLAALRFNRNIVKILLDNKAEVEGKGCWKLLSILHIAVAFDMIDIVQICVEERNYDLKAALFGSITPMQVAMYFKSDKSVEYFSNKIGTHHSDVDKEELLASVYTYYVYAKNIKHFYGMKFWLRSMIPPLDLIETVFGNGKRLRIEEFLEELGKLDAKFL